MGHPSSSTSCSSMRLALVRERCVAIPRSHGACLSRTCERTCPSCNLRCCKRRRSALRPAASSSMQPVQCFPQKTRMSSMRSLQQTQVQTFILFPCRVRISSPILRTNKPVLRSKLIKTSVACSKPPPYRAVSTATSAPALCGTIGKRAVFRNRTLQVGRLNWKHEVQAIDAELLPALSSVSNRYLLT